MARAKKAVEIAYEGVTPVQPQPMPGKIRAKKAPVPVPVAPVPAAPVAPVPVAPVTPVQKVKKRMILKEAPTKPVAVLDGEDLPVESIQEIKVRHIEIDGRSLYLDPQKEKIYDLKFKYLGRLKDGQIHAFPDSDADL